MKAILVKYLPATNTKGARLKAYSGEEGQTIIEPYDYNIGYNRHALELAYKLCERMGWNVILNGGQFPNGDYVFTIIPTELQTGLEMMREGKRCALTMGSLSLGLDKLRGIQ